MALADSEMIALVNTCGASIGELFLVGERIYRSEDAGDFQAQSSYIVFEELNEWHDALVSLLRRLSAPEYKSIEEVDTLIVEAMEFEELLCSVPEALSQFGTQGETADDDFVVHYERGTERILSVAYASEAVVQPAALEAIASVLRECRLQWQVQFVPLGEGAEFCVGTLGAA